MPFIKQSTLNRLNAISGAVTSQLEAEANVDELLAEDGALVAALQDETEAREISAEEAEQVVVSFLEAQGYETEAECSAEDTFAAITDELGSVEAQHTALAEACATAGVELPELVAGAYDAEALTGAFEKAISKKGARVAASAGATTDETPETTEEPVETNAAEILDKYQSLSGSARTEYFAEHRDTILAAQSA